MPLFTLRCGYVLMQPWMTRLRIGLSFFMRSAAAMRFCLPTRVRKTFGLLGRDRVFREPSTFNSFIFMGNMLPILTSRCLCSFLFAGSRRSLCRVLRRPFLMLVDLAMCRLGLNLLLLFHLGTTLHFSFGLIPLLGMPG